jgi:hypothetical protein
VIFWKIINKCETWKLFRTFFTDFTRNERNENKCSTYSNKIGRVENLVSATDFVIIQFLCDMAQKDQ